MKDPSGVDIVPWELAFDEKLGVVVEASLRDLDAPRWILAQRRPGSGPGAGIVELH